MLNRLCRCFCLVWLAAFCAAVHAVQTTPYESAKNTYKAMFFAGKYDELERAGNEARQNHTQLSDGNFVLEPFYAALEPDCACDPEPQKKFDAWFAQVEAWRKAFPHSVTVELLNGQAVHQRAWLIRGQGYANTVSPDAWKGFYAGLDQAFKTYAAMSEEAKADPSWFAEVLRIANFQGWPEDRFIALFKEGVKRHPEYWKIHENAAFYFDPKWHGSQQAQEAFITYAASLQPGLAGDMTFVRMLWRTQKERGPFVEKNWARIKTGYDYLIEKYPDGWSIVHYMYVVCTKMDLRRAFKVYNEKVRNNPAVLAYLTDPAHPVNQCIGWAEDQAKLPLPPGMVLPPP